jgi:hypothetical protein
VEQQEVVNKLKALRKEFEKDGVDILYMPIPMALVLSDVCEALGLNQTQHDEVLGEEASGAIREWADCRMWQPVDKETATVPRVELAAVPA